jgi:hypothetical protein
MFFIIELELECYCVFLRAISRYPVTEGNLANGYTIFYQGFTRVLLQGEVCQESRDVLEDSDGAGLPTPNRFTCSAPK